MSDASYRAEPIDSWEVVDRIAREEQVQTCIRYGGPNNTRAAQTWQEHYPQRVRYYAIYGLDPEQPAIGYVRLMRVTESEHMKPGTWVVDFAKPMDYEQILVVARVFGESLLVKKADAPATKYKEFAANWPSITAAYPMLGKYPYHVQQVQESTWLVVPQQHSDQNDNNDNPETRCRVSENC